MAPVRPSPFREPAASRSFACLRSLLAVAGALLLVCPAASPAQKPGTQKTPPPQQQPVIAPPPTADQIAAQQHAQKVQDLVKRAEDSYQSGVANYNASHLDAARMDFDFAVDAMLSSGMDLKNDPALSDEFDHLLNAINSLEMVALQQGNGFSPKVEAAPLEEAVKEVTFPSNPVLVQKVETEVKTTQSDLPLVVNDYVAGFISYFSNSPGGHAHLKRSLERAGKYKDMIVRVLRENNVPQDLIYQAVAESGFQPQALNRSSGAGGMWQFMPFQGAYGLKRDGYVDERFDPEKSSQAYARYIKYLYNQFGDWYLAMAAYDWGPGRVQHLVSRTGYADYWDLYRHGGLPAETKAYVPGIIAAIIMAKNPQQYGLTDLVPDAPVLSDKVTTDYAINLNLVADLTNSSVQAIVTLNPALLRLTTPPNGSYDLHIPPGTRDVYLERLKNIPEDNRATWRFHVVKAGESLEEIASTLHARASEVAQVNQVTAADPIAPGDELVVPVAGARGGFTGQMRYTVRHGDTLTTVADRFGVTAEQLRSWNNLSSSRMAPGRSLYVAEPVRLAPSGRGRRGRAASSGRGGKVARGSARSGRGSSAARGGATVRSSHGIRGSAHDAPAKSAHKHKR